MHTTKTTFLFTLLLALSAGALLLATDAPAKDKPKKKAKEVFVQRVTGKLTSATTRKTAAEVKLGRAIRGVGKPAVTEWFGSDAVSGQVNVENPTDTEIHTSVTLVLYDKQGAVLAATNQAQSLDPKERTIWGGFVIRIPKAQLKQIASYEYIWYEDTKPIGQR